MYAKAWRKGCSQEDEEEAYKMWFLVFPKRMIKFKCSILHGGGGSHNADVSQRSSPLHPFYTLCIDKMRPTNLPWFSDKFQGESACNAGKIKLLLKGTQGERERATHSHIG